MSGHQPVIAGAVILVVGVVAGCESTNPRSAGAGTVTLVNRISAKVLGENCPGCGSRLEEALQRRLNALAITVDLQRQTIDAEFSPGSPFASSSFRQVVKDADAAVEKLEIEACGIIDTAGGRSWITSGSARLLLQGSGPFVTGTDVCVTGELQDLSDPPQLVIISTH